MCGCIASCTSEPYIFFASFAFEGDDSKQLAASLQRGACKGDWSLNPKPYPYAIDPESWGLSRGLKEFGVRGPEAWHVVDTSSSAGISPKPETQTQTNGKGTSKETLINL